MQQPKLNSNLPTLISLLWNNGDHDPIFKDTFATLPITCSEDIFTKFNEPEPNMPDYTVLQGLAHNLVTDAKEPYGNNIHLIPMDKDYRLTIFYIESNLCADYLVEMGESPIH